MKEIIEKRENRVLTGFMDLDNMIDGLHNSELIIIGARPGMGKTAFTLNIAKKVTNFQRISTVFFSMELSQEQILNRLNNMKMEDNDNLIIDDTPGITIDEIALKCRKLKKENKIGLVIIDYLQLIGLSKTNSAKAQILELEDSICKLKSLSIELNIPIIVTSQLIRHVDKRADNRPKLKDLNLKSNVIEKNVDTIMFIYRDEYYNKESEKKGIAEIIVAKQFESKVGMIELVWISYPYGIFANFSYCK